MNAPVPPPSAPAPSSLRTTLVLTAIVGVLALWIWLGEGQLDPSATGDGVKKRRVLPMFATADATRLELQPAGDAPKVALAREAAPEGDKGEPKPWRMEAPVADAADGGEVTRVLNAIEWLEFTDKLEGEHASAYDFGDVAVTARLERRGGKPTISLEVGPERLGKRPLRLASEPGVVYLVREALHKDLAQDPWKFRRKQLFNLLRDQLTAVTLRAAPAEAGPGVADREVVLRRVDGYWRVGGSGGSGGDGGEFAAEGQVDELIGELYGLQAAAVSAEQPGDEDLARLGLAPARVTVKLETRDGAAETLELGLPVEGAPARRHARFTDRAAALAVDASKVAKALDRPLEGWLSDALVPLRGSAATLTGFAVTTAEGKTWGLTKKEGQWRFDGEKPVQAALAPVEALLGDVLGLTIEERREAPADLAALGLDPPALKVALVQEPLRREVWIGAPVEGRPGVHHVMRAGEPRVYAVRVDALPGRLDDAPLELLDKTIIAASHWDAKKVVVTDPDGEVLLEAAKTDEGVREWKVTTPASPDAVSEKVDRFMEAFEAMKVERWLAHDSPEARARYGLDRAMKVEVTIETFKDGKKTDLVKTLLLGRREGDRVLALAEDGHAIGRVDAGFLERMARGFAKETTLLESDRWNARGLLVKDGADVVLELRKPAENWKRVDGGSEQILETIEVEDLLRAFEKVEVARAEPRTDARLAEVGLAPPARTITITLKPYDKPEETRTLLLGQRAGERDVWATAEGAEVLGALFDEPLRALDAWLKAHPRGHAFPPVDDAPGGGDEQGAAPPPPGEERAEATPPADAPPPPNEAPDEVACGVCAAMVPADGPFIFRDPRPPHPIYHACSAGHLEELKALLLPAEDPDEDDGQ
ncbi:MAG: DUF4340 domain-containing protein [Planctomycetes bacterium]|nr:DUF4340 domain-containing protein [Planctomycetota bacterium]